MYLECNLPIKADTSDSYLSALTHRCNFLRNLGWQGVALNISIDSSNIGQQNQIIQEVFPKIVKYVSDELEQHKIQHNSKISFIAPFRKNSNATSSIYNQDGGKDFKIYTRLTYGSDLHKKIVNMNFEEDLYQNIDIIALDLSLGQHLSADNMITYLSTICSKSSIDLLSFKPPLDITLDTVIRKSKNKLKEAIRRNVCMEFCYGDVVNSKEALSKFGISNWIQFLIALIRNFKTKQLIFSNGSSKMLSTAVMQDVNQLPFIRSPHDVANIVGLFGLSFVVGKSLITTNALHALKHAEMRKAIRGVVKVTELSLDSSKKRSFDQSMEDE
ncbi:hypothetical protein FDP41_008505 [Naegleria fowleri]|uniref:Uncharacterized protein n=1 Tax=Naegleria fowleri TaxID=5763 RepID=A0A6A5BGY9_NAEFO|nr:uncharacterized protein FDP41_008505 [Naegleria fowleri]KAF0973298.1 hypothetical protein FDP41_008505 [Naegleria fowleri]